MDEFSTPLDKLPSLHPVSTREEGGNPTTDTLSYEDLIRDQQSMPQQQMQSMPQQPMQPMQPMPQQPMQPMPQQPMQSMQPMQYPGGDYSDYGDYGDEYDPHPRSRRGATNETKPSKPSNAETSWVVAKLKTHKNDILATGLTLALLTVIIPRMRTMTRFENGIPLVAMLGISIAFASVLNTVTSL
jgi:hypothetical protein